MMEQLNPWLKQAESPTTKKKRKKKKKKSFPYLCCINRFTSLCKNLFNLLEVLAEAFRCHVHNFQCFKVPVNRLRLC